MRRIFALLLCLLPVLSALPLGVSAAEYGEEGDFYYSVRNEAANVLQYRGNDKIVEVPGELGGCPVIRVDMYAFRESSVEEVILPEGLRYIDHQAFADCASLRKINLPEGLANIGSGAFLRCAALENVAFPSTLTRIENDAFQKCTSLTEVVLPQGLTALQACAFLGCTGLKKVVLPSALRLGLTDTSVFQGCTALEEVVLPEGLELIPGSAFAGCTALKKIELPSALTRIESLAFKGCTGLSRMELPASVSIVGGGFLAGCGEVELVLEEGSPLVYENGALYNGEGFLVYAKGMTELPALKNGIDSYAFDGNTALKTAHIPAGVTDVRPYAFRNCTALEEVTIPWSVESLSGVFSGCKSLSRVTLYEGLEGVDMAAFSGCESLTEIRLPEGLLTIGYRAFEKTGLTAVYIPDSVIRVEQDAFLDCPNLTRIECGASEQPEGWNDGWAPEGVEVVWGVAREEDPAFTFKKQDGYLYQFLGEEAVLLGYEGTAKELNIPAALGGKPVTEIWEKAFSMMGAGQYAESMEKVVIPEGVKRIGGMAFYECGELSSVVLPDGLEVIGEGAFGECGLKKVKIPASVSVIPPYCFTSCLWMTEAEIPEGVMEIQEDAFYNCSLKAVSLPASVTEIHPAAFSRLRHLTSFTVSPENPVYSGWENCLLKGDTLVAALGNVSGEIVLPEGVRVIGENAFSSQKGLKAVVLPSTLEEIESGAFYGCESLGDIKIPEGVTHLGDRAFYGCLAMTEVILPESLEAIGREAFKASGLTSVYIPAGVTTIEDDAFSYCEELEELLFGATEKQEGWSSYMAQRCPLLKTENLVLGAENPYAPEEDAGGETSGEVSEDISAEASAETSGTVSAPPPEKNSFPWVWVVLAVAAVAAAVLVVAKKRK